MSDIAIRVENLSKKYRIGIGGGPAYHRLSEMLTGLPRYAYNVLRSPRTSSGPQSLTPDACNLKPSSDFWALKDVNFEVKQGEVVGIIGRNGAGKSTLLKILSRITEPTSGRFGIHGRVASLLEVGTGFHPELTGRENIYVSGITLGMTRSEIKQRFDEIVDFSGVEKFLDTAVKHYSSGMQVRLGFGVAANLESEVLIVDEVLAVGDVQFQQKCLGRMESVAGSGRTVLLVSHNMSAVRKICQRAVVLANGGSIYDGSPANGIRAYYDSIQSTNLAVENLNDRLRRTSGQCRITSIAVSSNSRIQRSVGPLTIHPEDSLCVCVDVEVTSQIAGLGFAMAIKSASNEETLTNHLSPLESQGLGVGEKRDIKINIPRLRLQPGEYNLYLWLGNYELTVPYDVLDKNTEKTLFNVVATDHVDPRAHAGIYVEDFAVRCIKPRPAMDDSVVNT